MASAFPSPPKPKLPKNVGDDNGLMGIEGFKCLKLIGSSSEIMKTIIARMMLMTITRRDRRNQISYLFTTMNFLIGFQVFHHFLISLHPWLEFLSFPISLNAFAVSFCYHHFFQSPLDDLILEVGEHHRPSSLMSSNVFNFMATCVGNFKAPINKVVILSCSPSILRHQRTKL